MITRFNKWLLKNLQILQINWLISLYSLLWQRHLNLCIYNNNNNNNNAVLLHDSLPVTDCTDWASYPLSLFSSIFKPPSGIDTEGK